ncbi:uncharacterized protein N7483_002600 [Penicillium malachiteum]|uniref:uncharacterized protein n=1 Tax=Penicillium malachiteum TaxID=1324776 RepID=UPI002546BB28|nr:uncharacterized protein N7483_002600 [Penicillium malachiteum]KAJ5737475.1 hypothetical protein N7483_002600 [Penicillium malachiteum]
MPTQHTTKKFATEEGDSDFGHKMAGLWSIRQQRMPKRLLLSGPSRSRYWRHWQLDKTKNNLGEMVKKLENTEGKMEGEKKRASEYLKMATDAQSELARTISLFYFLIATFTPVRLLALSSLSHG